MSTLFLPIIIIFFIATANSVCTSQRCCSPSICTLDYCTQKKSQTWISTQNFVNYGYTKLTLSGTSCLPCAYDCQSCSSQTICTTCAQGFYSQNNQCLICSYSCNSCVVINSISKCSACATGTYLDTATTTCKNCPTGAASCSSVTVISQCQTGYYLTSNSMFCLSCPANCQSCPSSNTLCSSCNFGYYLNANVCYQCSITACASCSYVNNKQACSTCITGYYFKTGSCLACSSNCITCSSSLVCTVCSTGFYLISGGCMASSLSVQNCNAYSSSTTCSNCLTGFYLSQNQCYPCSILCSACYGLHFGACTACTSFATLFNQMCLPNKYLTNNNYQLYYSMPSASSYVSVGSQDCNHYLYSGTKISLNLNNMAASKISIKWRIFSIGGSTTYTATLTNSAGNQPFTFSTSSSSGQTYPLCSSNTSSLYSLSQSQQNYSIIKVNNSLSFSTNNGITLALQQVLVQITMCNSLCIQCSSVECSQCLMSNLYTQDAYCVYTCSSGYYIYLNASSTTDYKNCVQQCPVQTYALATNLSCAQCVAPCLSCLNQKFCLSCVLSYFLTQQNTCQQICPYRFFGQALTQTCQKCVGRCNECIDQQKCLNCNTGFYYASNFSCLDSCDPSTGLLGMYADLVSLTCKLCQSPCLNCQMEPTYCSSCQISFFFYNYTCLSSCPSGYFSDSNSICQMCNYPCQNCASNSTICTSCVDRYLLNNSCIADCPQGYFQNNIGLTCTSCQTGCSQCYGQASYCLICSTAYFLFNDTCISSCPNQYYGNSTTNRCQSCQGFCYFCLNNTFCISCKSNFLLSGKCVTSSQCPTNYYADIFYLQCLPCSSTCLTCQFSASTCTSCYQNSTLLYLQNVTCVSACSSTSYFPTFIYSKGICSECISPCLTCSNSSYCLSCVPGYMLSNGLCSTTCTVGYYFNSTLVNCAICPSQCLICNTNTFCQLCQSNYFVHQLSSTSNQCLSSCPPAYYSNPLVGSCQPCVYPCDNCTSPIDCVSCKEGALYLSRCLTSCPDTTFLDSVQGICSPCGGYCLTCSKTSTNCLSCQSSYYLLTINNTCSSACPIGTYAQNVTQLCLQCPSSCSSCLNSTYCLSCISGRTYLYTLTHNCISDCPLGYFANSTTNICNLCNSKCLTCTVNSTNCLSCANGYYLIRLAVNSFDCTTSCPDGYYQQLQNCYQCIFPCMTCAGAAVCLTCVTGTYYFSNTSACLLSCPANTYINNTAQACSSCISPCSSCRNSTFCLSCQNNLYILGGKCLNSCPNQYYSDNTQICNQCFGLCKTCSSKYYCLSCLTGYLSNGFCYSSCPPGTYANLNISQCVACITPCLQCTFSANYCTRCLSGLVQYQGNCSSTCPLGTYESDSTCLDCSFPCINCSSRDTCYQCLGGYLLYNGLTCINDTLYCPNDFYKMDGKYCIPKLQCPITYYIDQSLKTCSTSCSIEKYVDTDSKSCVYSCIAGQYVSVGMVCTNYSITPISLMNMNVIGFIKSSIMNIIVQFNQTQIWQNSKSKIYTLSATSVASSTSRLLIESYDYNLNLNDQTTLLLRVTSLPTRLQLNLPAQHLISATTNYPLQNVNVTVNLPTYMAYEYTSIYQGSTARQFGQGLSWFILLLSLFFLFKNRLSHLYILWDTAQLLFIVLFLNIQYPPALNQFLFGLSTTLFLSFPNIFTITEPRTVSDLPFYAYSHDNNFLRNAGPALTLLIIVIGIYLFLKLCELVIKNVQKVAECMGSFPRVKKFIYEMLLRYRWHYVSDIIFLTYLSLALFAVAQLKNAEYNPGRAFSNALCIVSLLCYSLFPIFVGYKLYKHFPNISRGKHSQNLRCFYRGIEKDNKFGVFLIVIRYFRKIVYAIVIGIFSSKPMYALPILMFTSILMALFIFINLPFQKRLSNIVETVNQICIALLFLGLALVNFNNQNGNRNLNIIVGYVCTALLIGILLMLVFQVFCKTLFNLQSEAEIRKKTMFGGDLNDEDLRKKAGQFFDYMFPKIRKQFGFGEDDSNDQVYHYEEGDSQNSQNNQERQKEWGIQSSIHSEQFRHYDNNSQSQKVTQPKQKVPEYLIRCVKQLK